MVYRGGRKADNIMSNIIYRLPDGTVAADWCRENKIPYGTFMSYIEKGFEVENACKAAKKARKKALKKPVTMYKGKTLKSQFPCGYVSIMAHIRNKNCSVDEAVDIYKFNLKNPHTPKNIKPVMLAENSKKFESIKACAEFLKVSPTTVRRYIKKGDVKWISTQD